MNGDEKPKEHSFIERIVELKHKSPFEKFRVVMTSGSSYMIEDPDLVAVGASRLIYCVPQTDRVVEMRWNQISEIETTGQYLD
ncbi:MAG TPA: hypothetical protein PKB10_15585 [Tepidisphaeraceae bacterium]|nr:hypothetical protein [Tepidisphaeraceae bacterium]